MRITETRSNTGTPESLPPDTQKTVVAALNCLKKQEAPSVRLSDHNFTLGHPGTAADHLTL